MKNFLSALVYTGLLLGAIAGASPVAAQTAPDVSALLRQHATGALRKLAPTQPARPLADVEWTSPDGPTRLRDYRGKWVLLNVWAVWCAPCREEMPTLAALQAAEGGRDFAVVTLASGPNDPGAVARFLAQAGASALPHDRDPKAQQARDAGIFGMPVTLLVDPQGREVARLIGGADWNSDAAKSLIAALPR